jgi:putative membrane-bound dehydrogenase-like protein
MYIKNFVWILMICLVCSYGCQNNSQSLYKKKEIIMDPQKAADLAREIEKGGLGELHNGLELSLWASDSLTRDPIAISIDPQGGIYYTRAIRMQNSEFDIRGHREWMTKSISWQTVEDRRDFLHANFPEDGTGQNDKLSDLNEDGNKDWKDLAVQKEEVWRISDESGDGYADKATRYLNDFNKEYTDVANGIEFYDGDVYIGCAPDLWKTTDTNGDGIADKVESLAYGFGVHIGFSGHGMSGVIMGPDGRIYWGIGDIGMNLTDKEGKKWRYPNQGVVVRCEPDGSNFEVFAAGVRNTHEFVFDKYGNLISEDNDGDHSGERERLVYLINGSDSGWRSNWQYGKYTDPKNNSYKVWMDEKLSVPHWDGQAAYILPPIQNYVNGPTGFVYNPGAALSEEWKDHFFVAEFRGTPARSPIHAFTLEQDGASFKMSDTKEVVKGLLPTGLDFGPDGALYFADWIDGWDAKNLGRIWKIDVPGGMENPLRIQTKELLQSDFKKKDIAELSELIGHEDMRVRQKAQFEIVKKEGGLEALKSIAENGDDQLARIHALWGLGQLARKDILLGTEFISYLSDNDTEIIAQAVKIIGDLRYKEGIGAILPFINHENDRIKLLATEAAGRIGANEAMSMIVQMVEKNNDKDMWLRHAGAIALSRIGMEDALAALSSHESKAVKTVAVVALRRMASPKIVKFLADNDEFIVTEAARAINDDFSIPEAFAELAALLNKTEFRGEPLIRRVINANLRLGEEYNLDALLTYAENAQAPESMRAEALEVISTWNNPSVLDRVDGRYRGEFTRDIVVSSKIVLPKIDQLLASKSQMVKKSAIDVLVNYKLTQKNSQLAKIYTNSRSSELKIEVMNALHALKADQLDAVLENAMSGKDANVKANAISIIPDTDLSDQQAVRLISKALQSKEITVKQAAIHALATYNVAEAQNQLSQLVSDLEKEILNPALELDLIEAIDEGKNEQLKDQLEYVFADNEDPLVKWKSALEGGNGRIGRNLFNNHAGAQCTRCHTVFEVGGDAGPALADVGSRLNKRQILESLVNPSAVLALGYGAASLSLKDGNKIAGIILAESDSDISLKVGDETKLISKTDITERNDIPSSMPPMKDILTIREIRDVVAYLITLREEES